MSAYAAFKTAMTGLYEKLDAANHSISLAAHIMETDRTDGSISDYENAVDYAMAVRNELGALHEAEMRQRAFDACLNG